MTDAPARDATPIRSMLVPCLFANSAGIVPDSRWHAKFSGTFDPRLRWVLNRLWNPGVLSDAAALVQVRLGTLTTESLMVQAGPIPVECWYPAPVGWDGEGVLLTTTANQVQVVAAPAADPVKASALGWASGGGARYFQFGFLGFERPPDRAC